MNRVAERTPTDREEEAARTPPEESGDAWREQAGGLREEGRFKSGSWLIYIESILDWVCFFLCKKNLNRVAERTPTDREEEAARTPPEESGDAWREQAGGLREEGRFKSGSWLIYIESILDWVCFFLCKKNLNRVAKRTPTEQGGRGGKDAAGRERRRLKGAGRKPASERPVQVRELAMKMR